MRRDWTRIAIAAVATITLLTCYPFDAIAPGGPLRYVAVAGIKAGHTS